MSDSFVTIPGYPDYSIDREGQVRRDVGGRGAVAGRILRASPDTHGYLSITLRVEGASREERLHRLLALAFVPNPDGLHVARHLNDDRLDNRVENLAWGTVGDNIRDQVSNGLHGRAKRTRCRRGHEFTPENTRMEGNSRRCITCDRANGRAKYRRSLDAHA